MRPYLALFFSAVVILGSQACGDREDDGASSPDGRGGSAGNASPAPAGAAGDGGSQALPDERAGSAGAAGSFGTAGAGAGGALFEERGGTAGQSGDAGHAPEGGTAGNGGSTESPGGAGSGGGGTEEPDCVEFTLPSDCPETSLTRPFPAELRCTGLYGDWAARARACGVRAYAPAYELWSDGAEKHRFVSLPAGASIDASDPDNWSYPVGTQFWKEFWVGEEARLGETRLLRKTEQGWLYTTYVWSEDGSSALQKNDGVVNLFGTGHTVPTRDQCRGCHSGRPDFVLGWDLLMLGEGAQGITREALFSAGTLTGLPEGALESSIPGSAVERRALGYLHANCGVACHNLTEEATGRSSGLYLRLELATLESVATTQAVVTGLNDSPATDVALPPEKPEGPYYNLRPLDPERSLIIERMSRRQDDFAMPRFGTNRVDPEGIAAVTAWINAMTPENGYPDPEP